MSKPTVTYRQTLVPPVEGYSAVVVVASGHHTIPQEELDYFENVVTTSQVQKVNEDNSFETFNTLYVPVPKE